MHRLIDDANDASTDVRLFELLNELYVIVQFMAEYGDNFGKIVTKINSIIQRNEAGAYVINDLDFVELVTSQIEEIQGSDKTEIEQKYQSSIKSITINNLVADEE